MSEVSLTLKQIFEIYRATFDGAKQQLFQGEFTKLQTEFPRDPVHVAKGVGAALGLKIHFKVLDFYKDTEIPFERRDFFSFYQFGPGSNVRIFINESRMSGDESDETSLLSNETLRFVILKEVLTAAIRAAVQRRMFGIEVEYPDTVYFAEFMSAQLDWISERFSVLDFVTSIYAKTVKVENAAELLAAMFLVDICELFQARKSLGVQVREGWGLEPGEGNARESDAANWAFVRFPYSEFAERYEIKERYVIALVRTDFIIVIMSILDEIVADLTEIFPNYVI